MPIFPASSSHASIRFKKTVTVANTSSDNLFEYHNGLLDEFGFANNFTQSTKQSATIAYLSGFYRGLTTDATFGTDTYVAGVGFGVNAFYTLRYDAAKAEGKKYATILRDEPNNITLGFVTHSNASGVAPEIGFFGDFRGAFSRGFVAQQAETKHYTSGGLRNINTHANGVVDAEYWLKKKLSTFNSLAPGMVINAGVVSNSRSERFMQKMDVPRGEANNVFFAIESTHGIPTTGNAIKFSHFRNKGKNLKQWEIPSLMGYLAANTSSSQEYARNDFVADPYKGISSIVNMSSDRYDVSTTALEQIVTRNPLVTFDFGVRKGISSPSTYGSNGYRHHNEKTRNTKHTTLVFHNARARGNSEASTSSNVLTTLEINEFLNHINNNLELDRLSAGDFLSGLTDFNLGGTEAATNLFSVRGAYANSAYSVGFSNRERVFNYFQNVSKVGHSEFSYIHLEIPYSDLARVKSQWKTGDNNYWNASNLLVLPGKWAPADLGGGSHYIRNGDNTASVNLSTSGYVNPVTYPCKYGDIVLNFTASDYQYGPSVHKYTNLITYPTTPTVKAHQFFGNRQIERYSGGGTLVVQSIHDQNNPKSWGTAAGTYTTYVLRDEKHPDTYFGSYGQTQQYPSHSTDNQISVMRYIEP